MPKRQRTRTIMGGPQGDDAKLVIRKITIGEARDIQAEHEALQSQTAEVEKQLTATRQQLNEAVNGEAPTIAEELKTLLAKRDELNTQSIEFLAPFVLEWNWVDDDDEPLPQPKEDVGVLSSLMPDELNFIANAIGGGLDDQKKGN